MSVSRGIYATRRKVCEIQGQRFGRLVVIGRGKKPGVASTKAYWKCKCDCGNEHITRTDYLRNGRATSCGCWLHSLRVENHGAVWNGAITRMKNNAISRNLGWELSKDQALMLIQSPCHYCGMDGFQVRKTLQDEVKCTGIDRLDSAQGYTINNVVPCCKHCNFAKHTMGYQQFRDWVTRVYRHMNAKPVASVQSSGVGQMALLG